MDVKYKFQSNIPYSLHDMRVCGIEKEGEKSLRLNFENGYVESWEPFKQVNGSVIIEDVDFDCCSVYILSQNGGFGKFNGEKIELLNFIERYNQYAFEFIDETYGYNQVNYSGYLALPYEKDLIEFNISIYYEGNIVYETEN